MDLELFRKLLHNLLTAEVIIHDNDIRTLAAFEDTYCFQKALQPMFRNCAKINLHFHPLTITFWV